MKLAPSGSYLWYASLGRQNGDDDDDDDDGGRFKISDYYFIKVLRTTQDC